MSPIGQRKSELVGALAFAAAAAAAVLAMAGFSVDDAWIPVRYARHLASGAGYRFDVGGAVTDGVTPLPYAPLLSLFAHGASADAVHVRARVLGAAAWLIAAALLGRAVARTDARAVDRAIAGGVLALSIPVAAHASSGMETGLAAALATCAVCMFSRPWAVAALAGVAATFRPELVVWALVVSFGAAAASRGARPFAAAVPRAVLVAGGAILPFAVVVVVRMAVFGRPVPLAVLAKPSDLTHGAVYSAAALLACITPVFACAPVALARRGGRGAVIAIAAVAHTLAVMAAGGDWMPYARLFVPIAPSLVLASVDVASVAGPTSRALRAALALALGVYLAVVAAPAGRHVEADRRALAAAARPWLAGARTVAALDIGWPTSVYEGAVIDLAGLTDPSIAVLPGGHTSKRVDAALLLDRNPDVLLFFARGDGLDSASYERVVEANLARSPFVRERFAPRVFLPLGATNTGYVVWQRR